MAWRLSPFRLTLPFFTEVLSHPFAIRNRLSLPPPVDRSVDLHGEAEEFDEADGVFAVIFGTHGEARQFGLVEGLGRRGAGDGGAAFEEFDFDGAGGVPLDLVDKGVQRLAQRVEPLAVVDEVGVFEGHLLFIVQGVAFDAEVLEGGQGGVEDGAAGGFVGAAGLHADEAVFDEVGLSDAVFAAEGVELGDEVVAAEFFAIEGEGDALFEADVDEVGLVGGFGDGDGHDPEVVLGLVGGIFEVGAFVGDVPEVAVAGVDFLDGLGDGDFLFLGVFDGGLAGAELEAVVLPGGDDGEFGAEGHVGQFEADLVVALASSAVGDGVGTFLVGNLNLVLGDQGAGDGGAQEVLTFIDGAGFEHGEAVLFGEFLAEVFDDAFVGTGGEGFFLDAFEFVALAEFGGEGDDLAAGEVVLEPGENDGGIQPAGVGEHDLFYG